MKPSTTSLGPSTQRIIARMQKVKRAAEKAARRKHRYADYRYLRSVLSAYNYFEDNDLLLHLTEIAPSTLLTPVRLGAHPLRVLIDATCVQPDLKIRSRWARCLAYAVMEKIEARDLDRFLRAHNGIAGCADMASKIGRKRPRLGTKKRLTSRLFRQSMFSQRLTIVQ
jgi:hypothetical protein